MINSQVPEDLRAPSARKDARFALGERPKLADQNRARKDCLQFESGAFRHLWPLLRLEAFGLQGRRRLLLQFEGSHSYIPTPLPGEYAQVRDQVLNENLDPGCLNQFTVFDARSYAGTAPMRYVLESVEHQHANLAARGDWTIARDLRRSRNRMKRRSVNSDYPDV